MALLTVQHTNIAGGLTAVYSPVSPGGDAYPNSGAQTLHVRNLAAQAVTVTITAQTPCSQGVLHTLTFAVAPGAVVPFDLGPFSYQFYNDTSGNVNVTCATAPATVPIITTLSELAFDFASLTESIQINALPTVVIPPLSAPTVTQIAVTAS